MPTQFDNLESKTIQVKENSEHIQPFTAWRKKHEGITAPTRNWRFSASYDSFVVIQTLVLRMKFSGENRQLLVAAKRYGQV
jgi:hypothetical protein